jgi:beta-fructofuranosidase
MVHLEPEEIFYKPADGWAADFIPFYWNGEYHLFYLKDYRDPARCGEGTPWFHIGTRDFVHFTDYGLALPRGDPSAQDLYVFTGSAIEYQGRFHIFYTGHNPHLRKQGLAEQGVMHAVSDNLRDWVKVPADTFFAPADRFEPNDWRDPFVFWNEQAGEFWMLLAARRLDGPSRRRGCTALCTSRDLVRWEVGTGNRAAEFYAPGMFYTHECPDLFRMGDWWYLVFSEFSQACVTRYRVSRSLNGPWQIPANDTFDGRAFYAAKTASDGQRRYIFGWNPTREAEQDTRPWQWGGNLVAHELHQQPDGTLTVSPPPTVVDAFGEDHPAAWENGFGPYERRENGVALDAAGRFTCVSGGNLPETACIRAQVNFSSDTQAFGVMLRMSYDFEQGYFIRLEPAHSRLVFDTWPRAGDAPFQMEMERPLKLQPAKPVNLTILVKGSLCEVYADGKVAMSARMYNHPSGQWGVFAQGGQVTFNEVSLSGS